LPRTNRTIRNPDSSAGFITLARVVKTQGRRGEVATEVLSDVPDRFFVGMKLLALSGDSRVREEHDHPENLDRRDGRRELEVEELWPHKGFLVLKFAGVDSISEAEPLVGCELQVPLSQRSSLQAGWKYVSDLTGCEVFDGEKKIGRVEDVNFGAGEAPLLLVHNAANEVFEIPFAEAYVGSVEVEKKLLRMSLPEGLLEVNAPLTAEEKKQQAESAEESFKKRKQSR
jgi:16S rRNA processing protein RimM